MVPAKWPPQDSKGLGPCIKEPSSLSLVLGEASPPDVFLGSLDISMVPLDNSCLPEYSPIPPDKPCPDMEKGFSDLSSLALTLSKFYVIGEAHRKVYHGYGLKGSNKQIVFYEECVESPPSLVLAPSSLRF